MVTQFQSTWSNNQKKKKGKLKNKTENKIEVNQINNES